MSIFDPLTNAISDVGDFVSNNIPGGNWVVDAINSGADEIKTIASTTAGKVILVGITNALLFPAVAGVAIPSVSGMQTLGPQIASVVWAIPDVAAGGDFLESYAAEVAWRTQYLITFFSLGSLAGPAKDFLDGTRKVLGIPQVRTVTESIWKDYGTLPPDVAGPSPGGVNAGDVSDDQLRAALKAKGIDPTTLGQIAGTRADSAAAAIMGTMKRPLWDLIQDFNPDGSIKIRLIATLDASSAAAKNSWVATRRLRLQSLPVGTVRFSPQAAGAPLSVGSIAILALLTLPAWLPIAVPKVRNKIPKFLRRHHR